MGTLLNGRYELGESIGSGGMGRVHRALDTRLGRSVAIKILRVGGGEDDATARARFKAEATLAGSLHHPGIAQVYDVGEDESSPEREPFIVMQLVDGTPLSRLLTERGAIPPDGVAKLVGQVADALETAHLAGIVHRDLKPSNIVVTPQGRAVLVDFGIAWSAGSEPLTATGSIIGTAEYFSPEQAAGRPATARSDLYSLGIVAYHCLTGVSPFRRDTAVATAMAQLTNELPPLDASVPTALRTLITSLTQKEPDDRPSSAAIVASLANAETSPETQIVAPVTSATPPAAQATTVQPAAAAPPPPPTVAPTAPVAPVAPPVLPPPSGADERERTSSRWIVLAVVAVLLVLAAVLGAQALGGDDDDDPADPGGTTATSDSPTDDPTPSESPEPTQSSEEPDDVTVDRDSLIGLTYDDAADQLKQLGLSVQRVEETSSAPAGTVTGVSPSGSVEPGSTITLTVAKEAPETTAPPSETPPTEPTGDAGPGADGPGANKDDKGPKKP